MNIAFTKASACGNDFLVINGSHAEAGISELSRSLCDRHNGVGADGVEWLFPDAEANIYARLINADGSEAEISGNGTRCVAAYLANQGKTGKITVRTGAGIKTCELVSQTGESFEFETEMGAPQVDLPFSMNMSFGELEGTPVSMGNPHYVIFVNEFAPRWPSEGAEIGRDPRFPHGVNVEFVRVTGRYDIEISFYERGAGETQSSGTGSCACAVAAISPGRAHSPLNVDAPGGTQMVRWQGQSVFLRGPARLICQGEFFY